MQLLLKEYFVETTIFLYFALCLAPWGVIKTTREALSLMIPSLFLLPTLWEV